ncbi:MAG: hypothetical protein ABIH28_01745 [archaeon]
MDYENKVKDYVHGILKNHGVKNSNKIERALNYKEISKYVGRMKRGGMADEKIEYQVMDLLRTGAEKGGRGQFYTTGVPKQILRGAKQIGRKKIRPGSALFYLRHPVLAVRDGARKLVGYEPKDDTKKESAIATLARDFEYDRNVSDEVRERTKEAGKLNSYKRAIEILREGELIGGYRAKTLEHKIDRKSRKNLKELTDIISSEISAVLLFAFGAFLVGLSLGNPTILTGNAILENAILMNNSLIIGMGIFIIGFLLWLYIRRK